MRRAKLIAIAGALALPTVAHAQDPVVVYVNAAGGTYQPGADDARAGTSSLLDGPATIAAWDGGAARADRVAACLGELLSRWNVVVTDVDPGDAPHVEVVLGGSPADLGLGGSPQGIAPFDGECRVIANPIVFAFTDDIGHNADRVCEVAARELSRTFGLDAVELCADPTSYKTGCGVKSFQDVDATCGEFATRDCYCGAPTQNSVAMLDERIGPVGVGNPAPSVMITEPENGAQLDVGFEVVAEASDNYRVERVELLIDGVVRRTVTEAPYRITSPADLEPGMHVLEVRAHDHGGATGASTMNVVVGEELDDDEPTTGGCSAGGGAGGLGGLALLGLRWRRRRVTLV
jgi:hypothetical protein